MSAPDPAPAAARILVIKLGALGDVVLATGPFAAIRRHHPDARITLLTAAPFAEFLDASPWFDDIWIDDRPALFRPMGWLALRRRLRAGHFDRVYDLQTSDRSGWYFRLLGPGARPEWSGIVPGCSHRHTGPERVRLHTIDRHKAQLAIAGIADVPPPDLSWADADISRFGLAGRFALLVPGGAAHRPAKRWPAESYAALAADLAEKGVRPVVIGGADERDLARIIAARCAAALDLTGRTKLPDIPALARQAAGAVGNDTGPMHIIAASFCPSVVLFSAESDPALAAPRGPDVTVLRRDDLAALGLDEVSDACRSFRQET